MEGKVAIVTGAGAGIGRAIAVRLAAEGAAVVLADIDLERGCEAVRRIESDAGRALFVRADVTDESDVREMVAAAVERFGGLDLLVNNVGGAPEPSFPDAETAHWSRTLDLNLRATMLCIQAALPAMGQRGGGAVVNIASMAGAGFRPYGSAEYAAAKAGVIHLTAALGTMKPRCNVRVNCICPGSVATEAVLAGLATMTDEEKAGLEYPPPTVLIRPEQIGDLVVMCARDESLAGRVLLWPDGEPWRLIPLGATN